MLLCATKSGIYIHSKEFLLLPNANTLPAETFLFFFLPRKPSETSTSRALCTELWRQISVALQTFILLWFSYYSTADVQMWNETILQGAFVDQFLTLPLFFFLQESTYAMVSRATLCWRSCQSMERRCSSSPTALLTLCECEQTQHRWCHPLDVSAKF